MSEEELKKAIDIVAGIEVHSEAEAIAKEELMSYAEQLQQENNILAEFEKWLEERIKMETWDEWKDGLCECLDKLQELKNKKID